MTANMVNGAASDRPEGPIDREHLRRQTMGDDALAREVLGLFARQCSTLLALVGEEGAPNRRRDAAHTLKGAASAVGAWEVAGRAAAVEAAVGGAPELLRQEIAGLGLAIEGSREAIERLFGGGPGDEPSKSP